MYTVGTPLETVKWHTETCSRNRSQYEICVITLENGNETTCNPLTVEMCREVHKYEDSIKTLACFGNTSYKTLCEAFAATSYNDTDAFVTHVTYESKSCSDLFYSSMLFPRLKLMNNIM